MLPSMILRGTPPRWWLRALCENGGLRVAGQALYGPRRPERAGAGKPLISGDPAQRRLFHGGAAHEDGRHSRRLAWRSSDPTPTCGGGFLRCPVQAPCASKGPYQVAAMFGTCLAQQ